MYKFLLLFLSATTLLSCSANKGLEITVENTTSLERSGEIVEIQFDKLLKLKGQASDSYVVTDIEGANIPSQITSDGKLLLQVSLNPNEKKQYRINKTDSVKVVPKVSAKHHPERYGDFAWENDKVGFRFYGKELKEIQAATSGLDLWYKRTDKLVLDNWYADNQSGKLSYHVDHGEGCDPYAVGQTLGGGNTAILQDGILRLNENFDSFEILDNGPLRLTFKLTYPSLNINDEDVKETKTISLDAGSQLTKIVQEYQSSQNLNVVAGFPKRASGDSVLHNAGNSYFVYEEPADKENGQIYLGIIIPQGIDSVFVNKSTSVGNAKNVITNLPNIVAKTEYQANQPLTYYTGFGWNKFGFENVQAFEKYVKEYDLKLKEPLVITIK